MHQIPECDRERLRNLARRQLELANSPENERILKQWKALEEGRREDPTVRLLFSNFCDEVITPRMQCTSQLGRDLEWQMLITTVGRELFDDDTPISPTFDVNWNTWCNPFDTKPEKTYSSKGFHIDPVINDLEEDFDKLQFGSFGADREATKRKIELVEDVMGDILPVRMTMWSLTGSITNPLVMLMSMENYYFSMYDCPDRLHELMDRATKIYEDYYDFLEREQLLLPTCGISQIHQESFAFNKELPADKAVKTTDVWGFLESQETTAVSPDMYGEFVYPYQDRLVKRFGLLTYGCCERVDNLWEDYLSKWKKLRKLSVSPFNDERQVGEYLRGSNVVYYSKPRAEFVTNRGPLDEDALRAYFKEVCQCASGCLFEMAQREVGTIFGDYERGRRYVQIAKECIQEYWRP